MTEEHFNICNALSMVNCLPGTWDKRFIHSVSFVKPDTELSESQIEWIFRLLYKYRKQIPNTYALHQNNPLCSKKR